MPSSSRRTSWTGRRRAAAPERWSAAGGRTEDTTREAVLAGYIRVNNTTLPSTYTFHGLVFTDGGANSAISLHAGSSNVGSLYLTVNVKNCLFKNNSDRLMQGFSTPAATTNRIHDVTVKDCVFDGTEQDRRGVEDRMPLFYIRANFARIENFAILDQYCVPESVLAKTAPINADMIGCTSALEPYAAENIVFYSEKHCDAREVTAQCQQPTCMTEGKAVYTCTMCKKETQQILGIDPDAHKAGEMVITKPATATSAGEGAISCTACGDLLETVTIPATGEAAIGDTVYATLEEALSVAAAGQTVTLRKNVIVDYITVDPEITLDLNGHALTAGYVIGFKGSAMIDGSEANSGKLIAPKNRMALDKTNGGYLPVYEDNGYIFTTVKLAGRSEFVSATQFAFSPVFETFSHEALMEGYEKSGVEIIIRLTWEDEGNYRAVQDFTYLDERVGRVIGSYDASEANYGLAFAASFEGSEAGKAQNVQVTAVVVSDTGVEIAGAPVVLAEV